MSGTGRGAVRTPDGWPVAGARVTVVDGTGAQLASVIAGSDGAFELHGLRPGPATLVAAAPGHEPSAVAVALPAGPWDAGVVTLARTGAVDLPTPGVWVVDPEHSAITAQARHLGISSVRGGFAEFGGVVVVHDRFEASTTEVRIAAASISTNNATRDAHLRSPDFLDVERHPTLAYQGHSVERAGDGWVVVGELTMLGITRPVDLRMTFEGMGPDPWGGTRAGFSASTVLRREDFDMGWNQAVGLGLDALGTTLRVTLDVQAVLQQD